MWDLQALLSVVTSFEGWIGILSLVILEGVLSTDNALVLAVLVRHLPEKQQKKALFYGIWGAYLFRFIAISIGMLLIKIWWVKLLGAFYLLHMAYSYFMGVSEEDSTVKEPSGFWRTVATVEMLDIAFSMDSILTAFGVTGSAWMMLIGGCLGILMMRAIANVFIELLKKIPEFESVAYYLIAFVGIKMVAELFGAVIPTYVVAILIVVLFTIAYVIHRKKVTE